MSENGDATFPPTPGETRMHSLDWYPAYFRGRRKFEEPPTLLVIHSAAKGTNPAKWLHNPVWREDKEMAAARSGGWPVGINKSIRCADGKKRHLVLCPDGKWRRMGGAHISARSADGDFSQQGELDMNIPHAGGSNYKGRRRVNYFSIGVELPGREGPGLIEQWRDMVGELVQIVPSLESYTCHRWIRKGKTDPVILSDERVHLYMEGSGLSGE
jgi:hypothetical protein